MILYKIIKIDLVFDFDQMYKLHKNLYTTQTVHESALVSYV